MTISGKTIMGLVQALAVAGVVGLGVLTAPAMAQVPGFGFGPGFDNQNWDDRFAPQLAMCLTDREIRQSIANRGYSQVSLNVPHNKRIQVRATKGGTVYLIKFNFCTDRIEDRQALRRAN